jgi:O-antigen/teichoic acid export membrane protein
MNKYLGYFISLLSSKLIRAIFNLLFIALLARILGPDGLGEWAMVLAAGTLLHSLLLNWMHAPTVRFGRQEWQKDNSIRITWSARLPYLLIAFGLCGYLVIADPKGWLESYFHLTGAMKLAVVFALSWLWLSIETQNFLQLRQMIVKLAFLPVLIDLVPVLILSIILIKGVILPPHLLITGLLGVAVILWGLALSLEIKQLNVRWVWPGIEVVRKTFGYAWPLIPGFLLGYLSDWGDQLLLRYFFTNHEVGLFQAAYQWMILFFGVTVPLGMVIFPKLIDNDSLSLDATKNFLLGAQTTVITLGLFLLVPIVSFAPFFFRIFMGAKFTEANLVFVVLCCAIPGSIISVFYGVFFSLQGRLWRSTVVYGGLMSALNMLISLILLPRIGMIGSAVATGISYLVVQFLYLTDQHRYYRLPLFKSYVLFGFILVFAVIQAAIANSLLFRFLICMFFMAVLIFLAKAYALLDREWVLRILSGRLSGVGKFMLRFTEALPKDINHA